MSAGGMTVTSDPPDLDRSYRQHVDVVIAALGTEPLRGLSDDEAESRLRLHGRNELMLEQPVPAWRRFPAQFQDVLVILVLIATGISVGLWAYERDAALPYEAIAILAVVLLNATMGYVQASRAEAAVAALRALSAADATVIREGRRRSVPATDIVPGDIIIVEEGDTIPADARLIESVALQTAEAALTGESLPVTKEAGADWLGRPAGRSAQHGLQRYRRDLWTRDRGRDRDRHADRDGSDRRVARRHARRGDTAATRARSDREDARPGRGGHRRRDDWDDHPGRTGARPSSHPRCADSRRRPRGRRRS
jgi:magnesium-transporting ATPase (P-type)